MARGRTKIISAEDWIDEDHLILIEGWSRDGYSYTDIANKIGISNGALVNWRTKYPKIAKALKNGREIVDYKVENALLKSALGYTTQESKVTVLMRGSKVVEKTTETLTKEQAPNVLAIQTWLYNRLPNKWKNTRNRSLIDELDEDTNIEIVVSKANGKEVEQSPHLNINNNPDETDDKEWQDEVNTSVTIRGLSQEEKMKQTLIEKESKRAKRKSKTKVNKKSQAELDYWPDDFEE